MFNKINNNKNKLKCCVYAPTYCVYVVIDSPRHSG